MTAEPSDYDELVAAFRWEDCLAELGWTGRDRVNLGASIVDRHGAGSKSERTALHWLDGAGSEEIVTYRGLAAESARFANLLCRLGVEKGDRVAALMPRVPATFAAILGVWKIGAIYVPIFSGFGPDGIRFRLDHSGAKILCTHRAHRDQVPADYAGRVICVESDDRAGDIDYGSAVGAEAPAFEPVPCRRDDPAALIYTSGSTGQPKGGIIAVNLLLAVWPYLRYGVDLRADDDVFWPTGDPGWGYGLCCYLPAFAAGATVLSLQTNPTAESCLEVLARYGVTNLATTPTLLRAVMALGEAAVGSRGMKVRAISSCGEPLNAEVVEFFRRALGASPMDHFGATELALPIGNFNRGVHAVKPGSMGRPMPGAMMAVVDEEGEELPPGETGFIGQRNHPNGLYWQGYWEDPDGAARLVRNGWTCTGDLGRRDGDGYFWFEGRADDIIKSAGYRIGPFEVESAILEHPAVKEAAVVGVPDPLRGQLVKAFVVLKPDQSGSTALGDEIAARVRERLGRHQYPRVVEFVDDLPKTETGKIQRFRLRGHG